MVLAAAVYQIPNTEHMAYRLVRTLVYKRGVGIRETVWVGVWFGKSKSVGLFLPAEPRRRSVPLHGVLDGGVGHIALEKHFSFNECELVNEITSRTRKQRIEE